MVDVNAVALMSGMMIVSGSPMVLAGILTLSVYAAGIRDVAAPTGCSQGDCDGNDGTVWDRSVLGIA